jgi:hypothetical protein
MCGGIDIGDDFLILRNKGYSSLVRIAESVESAKVCQKPESMQCQECKEKITTINRGIQ